VAHWHECNREHRFTCDWIFNILVVLSDGKVVCGCADPYGERPLGHLGEDSILDIWNSPMVRQIRRELNQGHCCFCDPCGLKRYLEPGESPPERPERLDILPRIFLEPTVRCNLSCFDAVCNRESGIVHTRNRAFFPFEDFTALMDQIGEQLIRVDLFNYGEPFVHPQAVDMVEYIKRQFPQIFLYVSTNGLALDRGKIDRLVDAGLDEITFSVDGVDQETYAKYRIGGDFSRIVEKMSMMVQSRNEAGWEVPYINWRYILFKWNDTSYHMNRARRLARKIGVDRLTWEITDHPPTARSERYQIGTHGWRRIYREIWDSSQIGNAIVQKRYRARIKVLAFPGKTHQQQPLKVRVRVKNTGGGYWWRETRSGRRIVRLGAQLYDVERQLVELNFARAGLHRGMGRGASDTLIIDLPPFPHEGVFWLKFDMVSEGIDWFELGGSDVVWKRLKVEAL